MTIITIWRCKICMGKTELAPLADLRCLGHPDGPHKGPHEWQEGTWTADG